MTAQHAAFDPVSTLRRRAAEEALAAAADLTARADELRLLRARLDGALGSTHWRSDAALACRTEGEKLTARLHAAATACADAAAQLRSQAGRSGAA